MNEFYFISLNEFSLFMYEGTSRKHRVEGPLAEIEGMLKSYPVIQFFSLKGDVFDRQRCINLFNQPLIEQQVIYIHQNFKS